MTKIFRTSALAAGLAAGAALWLALIPQADARRFGGPGFGGGLSHFGTAMSLHAPGGGEFRGFGGGGFRRFGDGGFGGFRGAGERLPDAGDRWNGDRPYAHPYAAAYPYAVGAPVGGWWGWDADPGWDAPVGAAVAAGVVAGAAAAAIGSTAYSLPANCTTVPKNNLTYFNCNGVWYQPHYLGSGVAYAVIPPP